MAGGKRKTNFLPISKRFRSELERLSVVTDPEFDSQIVTKVNRLDAYDDLDVVDLAKRRQFMPISQIVAQSRL